MFALAAWLVVGWLALKAATFCLGVTLVWIERRQGKPMSSGTREGLKWTLFVLACGGLMCAGWMLKSRR